MKCKGSVCDSVVSRCSHIVAIVSLSMYRSPQIMLLADFSKQDSAILVHVSLLSDICADVWLVRFE